MCDADLLHFLPTFQKSQLGEVILAEAIGNLFGKIDFVVGDRRCAEKIQSAGEQDSSRLDEFAAPQLHHRTLATSYAIQVPVPVGGVCRNGANDVRAQQRNAPRR